MFNYVTTNPSAKLESIFLWWRCKMFLSISEIILTMSLHSHSLKSFKLFNTTTVCTHFGWRTLPQSVAFAFFDRHIHGNPQSNQHISLHQHPFHKLPNNQSYSFRIEHISDGLGSCSSNQLNPLVGNEMLVTKTSKKK